MGDPVSVADIFNLPGTQDELIRWGRMHMMWHREMNQQIFRTNNILLPEYALDPPDFSMGSAWLRNHQTMHNGMDTILGVSPYNLIDVKWNDRDQAAGWIQLHAQLTDQEARVSGVWA